MLLQVKIYKSSKFQFCIMLNYKKCRVKILPSGGGQGAGARENRGREGYGRREKNGREAGSLR